MHAHTDEEQRALAEAHYEIHVRTVVGFDRAFGTFQVFSPEELLGYEPFLGATITADLDQLVARATIRLRLGTGAQNLSPYITQDWTPRPIFDPGLYIRLDCRCLGGSGSDIINDDIPWRPFFIGRIDSADPSSGELVLECRDLMADLLDDQIEPSASGGWTMDGAPIQALISQLLDIGDPGESTVSEHFQAHWTSTGVPTLFVPSYIQQPGSRLLALHSAALLNGWDLRGKWVQFAGLADEFWLIYSEPDRGLVGPPLVIGPSRYFSIKGLTKSRDEVRNRVSVTPAAPPRTPVILQDVASITNYGTRFLGVVEDEASRIVTPDQALALATAILSDTKEPKVMAELETRFHPFLEINDVLNVEANQIHHDTALVLALSGYTHTLTKGGGRTVIRTRDLPAAANAEWRKGTPKMHYISTDPPSGVAAKGARWTQIESPGTALRGTGA